MFIQNVWQMFQLHFQNKHSFAVQWKPFMFVQQVLVERKRKNTLQMKDYSQKAKCNSNIRCNNNWCEITFVADYKYLQKVDFTKLEQLKSIHYLTFTLQFKLKYKFSPLVNSVYQ